MVTQNHKYISYDRRYQPRGLLHPKNAKHEKRKKILEGYSPKRYQLNEGLDGIRRRMHFRDRLSIMKVMKLNIIAFLGLVLMAACACTKVVNAREKILAEFYKETVIVTDLDESDALRNAAFEELAGKSRIEAVEILEDSGFDCEMHKCNWVFTHRDSAPEIVFGVSPNIRERSQIGGERYSFQHSFEIEIVSEIIRYPDDIKATFARTTRADSTRG